MRFSDVWKRHEAEIDLGELRGDLAKIRVAMQAEAKDEDQAIALGEVANAEKAVEASDGPRILEHLHRAGPWALKVSENMDAPEGIRVLKYAQDV
jgi:hypothetical protein